MKIKCIIVRLFAVFFLLICLTGIISTWVNYFEKQDAPQKIIKCYDKYNNEIIGQDCIETGDMLQATMFLTFMLVIIITVASFALLHPDMI